MRFAFGRSGSCEKALGTTRSSDACRTIHGTSTCPSSPVTLTSNMSLSLARKAAFDTLETALRCSARSSRVENCPKMKKLCAASGKKLKGTKPSKGFRGAHQVTGFRAKEQQRIRPASSGGWLAAMEIATGPENDSPKRT